MWQVDDAIMHLMSVISDRLEKQKGFEVHLI